MSKTVTLPKKALSTKEFQEGKHKEPTMNENTEKEMLPAETNAPEQKLMHISIETYVASLQTALASAKYALNMQLAVSMAVFHEHGGPTRSAKRFLYQVYDKAGWNCATPNDIGYKSVSRRVFAANLLYLHIGADRINDEIAGAVEGQLIVSLVNMLTPMNITSVDNLLQTVGRPRLPAAKAAPQQIEGEQSKQQENNSKEMSAKEYVQQLDDGQKGGPSGGVTEETKADEGKSLEPGEIVLPEVTKGKTQEHTDKELPDDVEGPRWMRRAEDIEGATHLDSPGVHITIAPNADKDEIVKIAKQLMALAAAMNGHNKEHAKEKEHEPEGMLQAELRKVPEPMKQRGRRVIR